MWSRTSPFLLVFSTQWRNSVIYVGKNCAVGNGQKRASFRIFVMPSRLYPVLCIAYVRRSQKQSKKWNFNILRILTLSSAQPPPPTFQFLFRLSPLSICWGNSVPRRARRTSTSTGRVPLKVEGKLRTILNYSALSRCALRPGGIVHAFKTRW